jgi:hypothetical protein
MPTSRPDAGGGGWNASSREYRNATLCRILVCTPYWIVGLVVAVLLEKTIPARALAGVMHGHRSDRVGRMVVGTVT